ncbi:MAG TPA: SDR family NAD(P)-dependent oxidoreductase [Polyangiales bacterium]|nr:SDR family NAD(P)-dependent oxidoreductase [Polyangiales bacterium]
MKIIVLGATKGIGRAFCRLVAERGHRLFLLGHESDDLERSARDLEQRAQVRAGSELQPVQVAYCNLEQPESFGPALEAADAALEGFDTVVVTAALFGSQEALEENTDFARRLLTVNFANTVAFCELARKRLLSRGGGTLCVISSVAGERGRKPVIIYGAGKAGLTRYLEGLDHKFRAAGLRTICIKPGFVKTSMTEGLKPPPFAAEPEDVARGMLSAIERGTPVRYTPHIWALIMLVIRWLPRFVMRKIGF